MRFIIMHKTNAHWEAGAIPSRELIARVGALIGELAQAGVFHGGEGLRASSEGVRLTFSGGTRTIVNGPFEGGNELPAGFSILRARSLDEAIEWATRQADVRGDEEVDIRPVTEPWDIGMTRRFSLRAGPHPHALALRRSEDLALLARAAGAPADVSTRRYMVLRKATAATEAGEAPSSEQRTALSRLIEETTRTGMHLATETMRPSRRGRRYKNSADGVSVFDGPFVETKELLAGYTIVSGSSLDDVDPWARRYVVAVEADEVDVRELK